MTKFTVRQTSFPHSTIPHVFGNHVAIANRAAGTVSRVDPLTLETATDFKLPDNGEPMYLAQLRSKSEIWVGDRQNNRHVVLRLDGSELKLDGFVETPAGIFHSIHLQRTKDPNPIVVTACDMDNVSVAHDLTSRRLLGTMRPPKKAAKAGTVPHDISTNSDFIFVTYLGSGEQNKGFVASCDATTFDLIAVLETAHDPHVAIRDETALFIAALGTTSVGVGLVYKVSIPYLKVLVETERPSPHGMFISFDSKYLYTTNIRELGEMAIDVWDVETGSLMIVRR